MNQFQKTSKKLEQLRSSFFLLGLIIAGGFTFLAFEWTTTTHTTVLAGVLIEEIEGDFDYVEPFEIEKEIEDIIKEYEPRAILKEINVIQDDSHNRLDVTIKFKVVGMPSLIYEMVLPLERIR